MPEKTRRRQPDYNKIITQAIRDSGVNVDSLEPLTREEAWQTVAGPLGWQSFLDQQGLMSIDEINIRNRSKEVVGVAFFGPKVPSNPSLGKQGAIGIKGRFIGLGYS